MHSVSIAQRIMTDFRWTSPAPKDKLHAHSTLWLVVCKRGLAQWWVCLSGFLPPPLVITRQPLLPHPFGLRQCRYQRTNCGGTQVAQPLNTVCTVHAKVAAVALVFGKEQWCKEKPQEANPPLS
jgi:hypothetical protein